MSRYLESHIVNPANDLLSIEVEDQPGAGGANHLYVIRGFNADSNPSLSQSVVEAEGVIECPLLFQNGAINEVGVNGITPEALLAVLIDRLEGFQTGPYANPYNGEALGALSIALKALNRRTQDRMKQGVEGTMAVGAESNMPAGPPGDPVFKGKASSGNPILQYFAFEHLPGGPLRDTSMKFAALAKVLEFEVSNGAEKSAGLRKLLEAKDCFVRASLPAS